MKSTTKYESESEDDEFSNSSEENVIIMDELSPLLRNIDSNVFRNPSKGNQNKLSN